MKVDSIDDGAARARASAFISYSRKDVSLAERLVSDLDASGVNAYLDRRDIAPGEAWRNRLGHLIAASDAVVFVISPDSVASKVCHWEVAHAHHLGKRLLPLVGRQPGGLPVPELLSARNWIYCRTDAEYLPALAQLAAAILHDIEVVREQTRLAQLAHDWAANGRSVARLLRGDALAAAERWLQTAHGQDQPVGQGLSEFLIASRKTFDADESARADLVSSAFRAQSDYLSARSADLLASGDSIAALCLAIESAPDRQARLDERRTRPFTPRSLAALSDARRHFTTFGFLPQDHRDLESLHAAPDASAFCGVRGNELFIFRGTTPSTLLAVRVLPAPVRAVAFSGDSMRLAVLLADGSAHLFDVAGLVTKLTVGPWDQASGIALGWRGTTLVLEGAGGLRAWSISEGELFCVETSVPDSASATTLLAPFRYGSTIAPVRSAGWQSVGEDEVRCLDWSAPTRRWLAVEREQVSLRSLPDGGVLSVLALPADSEAVQGRFSGDGSTLVVTARRAGHWQYLVFSAVDGQLVSTTASDEPCGPGAPPPICALSADGAILVSVSGVQLSRRDARTGERLQKRRLAARLNPWVARGEFALRPSPQGDFVAVLLDPDRRNAYQVTVLRFDSPAFDALDARSPFSVEGAYGLAWSAGEDQWFAAFGHSADVVVVAASDLRRTRTLQHPGSRIDDGIRWAAFGAGGNTLITCSYDGNARLWDVARGVQLSAYEHPTGVMRAAFSRDGVFVVTLDDGGTVRVFPAGGRTAVAAVDLPGARDIDVTGDDVIVQTDRLLFIPGLLDAARLVEECCALLPRDLTMQERMRLDLPPDSPECLIRHRKWPALLGQSFAGVISGGGAFNVIRTATVEPARRAFQDILDRYGHADIPHLVALADFVWTHHVGAMDALCRRHNLTHNNEEFELAGEIFAGLLEVAEEYRAPDLPAAMLAAYRGPAASGRYSHKARDASRRVEP